MPKDLLEPEPIDLLAPDESQMQQPAVPQKTVYLADENLTVGHPQTMSYDQVNDVIQTDIYKRPRFNFYGTLAVAGPPGVAANAAAEGGAEPIKGILRGAEQQVAMVGSLSRWFGENLKRQADLNDVPDSLGGKIGKNMAEWGQKHYEYWMQQQQTGVEAPDPEMFRGSFVSNPSWARAATLVAEAVPSLATATAITFITKSPTAGAMILGFEQGAEEANKAMDTTGSLDTANAVGAANSAILTALESISLSHFLKGGSGAKHIIVGAVEEGVPEGLQQIATNFIAAIGYDKTRNLFDGVLESIIAGAGSGGMMGGFTSGRGAEIDTMVQEAHEAGVSQSDIDKVREIQSQVVIKNADKLEGILQREAKAAADKIEVIPADQVAEAQKSEDVKIIDDLIDEREATITTSDNPEEVINEIDALKEMRRKIQLEQNADAVETQKQDISEIDQTKRRVNAVTGQTDLSRKRLVSEMQSLKQSMRDQAKGSKAGFKEGLRDMRAQMVQKAQLGQMKRDEVVDYINSRLPKTERGRFLTMVRDAKSSTDLLKAFSKIDAAETQFNKKALIYDIAQKVKKLGKAKNISVDYKNAVRALGDLFNTSATRESTLKSLQATKDFIDAQRQKGVEVDLPQHVYDSLKRLKAVNLKDLPIEEVELIHESIETAIELGRTKLKTRTAIVELQKERLLTHLEQGITHKLESVEPFQKQIGESIPIPEKFKDIYRNIRDYATTAGNAMLPMDHFFQAMGDAAHRVFKRALDVRYKPYRERYYNVSQDTLDIADRLGIDENGFERIAAFLIDGQENGRDKLKNLGYTDAEIEAATGKLSPEEKEMAAFFRKHLEDIRPEFADYMARVHNKQLGVVPGYFPFRTDFTISKEWDVDDRLSDALGLPRKNPDLGMAKERQKTAGDQKVRLDALNIFLEHMDNVLYAVHLGEGIKTLQELAGTPRFAKAAGDIGQYLTREWLDTMARKGGTAGDMPRAWANGLAFFRRNTGRAMLVLNPSSVIVQSTALLDGAGLLGNYAWQGAKDLTSPEWRKFATENSTVLRARQGDDPAFSEFKETWLDKGYIPTKWSDAQTATAVFIGAYQKYLNENNLDMDFKTVNPEAMLYAEDIVVRTQASSSFKDLPLMLSKGIGLGGSQTIAKTATQFQTPIFFRWANLSLTARKALMNGDKGLAFQIAAYHIASTAAEMAVRNGTKAAILGTVAALAGVGFKDDKEKDKSFAQNFLETEMGNIPLVSNAVSFFAYEKLPAPALAAIAELAKSTANIFMSDDPEMKAKWLGIAALELAGVTGGVPLTFRAANTIKQIEE